MRTVYLRNGTAALLHKELPDGEYLIERVYRYDTQEGERKEGCGEKDVVSEIFLTAPIELIDAEYALASEQWGKLTQEISVLLDEKHKLENEIKDHKYLLSKLSAYELIDRTHDEYLTDAQIQSKKARKAQQVANDIAKQENVIKQAQDAILKLKGE